MRGAHPGLREAQGPAQRVTRGLDVADGLEIVVVKDARKAAFEEVFHGEVVANRRGWGGRRQRRRRRRRRRTRCVAPAAAKKQERRPEQRETP
jgi:hypothetical protein